METVELIKKARDEVQALVNGTSTKLTPDVIGWIRRDMSQTSEYTAAITNYSREFPDIQWASRSFNNFGIVDTTTVGGRMFVEKVLRVSLSRLNQRLYTLGEQETPYGDEIEKARRLLRARKDMVDDVLKRAFGAIQSRDDSADEDLDNRDPNKRKKKPQLVWPPVIK